MEDILITIFLWVFVSKGPVVDLHPGDKVRVTSGILASCETDRIMFYDYSHPDWNGYGVRGWCGTRGWVEAFVQRTDIQKGWKRKNGKIIY